MDVQRPKLIPPGGAARVLLHSCCAPCAADIMSEMTRSGVDYTIL
ncbi:MAG: epoxyqueuosine reductase QueH, partial [Gammaproteobacteria bacterium]